MESPEPYLSDPRHMLAALAFISVVILAAGNTARGQSTQYFAGDGSALNTSKYSDNPGGPFTDAFVSGNIMGFAVANGTGTGQSVTVGGFNATENFTLTAVAGTITVGGVVRDVNVASGKTLNLALQAFSTAVGSGLNKKGDGVLAMGATSGDLVGGFTLTSGTMVLLGDNGMGNGALVLNGGTVAASSTPNVATRYTGITIGGNVQFGALSTSVPLSSSTANLTFNNNVSLGSATRTVTIGANGIYRLGGIISGDSGTGLTIDALAGVSGSVLLAGINDYSGTTTITNGTLQLAGGAAIPNMGAVVLANTAGATLRVNANETIGSLAGGGNVILAADAGLTVNGTTSTTYSGIISGTISSFVSKQGAGVLTLSGANTYSGTTDVSNGGVVRVSNDYTISATGTGSVGVADGGKLEGNGAIVNAVGKTVDIATGGTIAPGDGPTDFGLLNTNDQQWLDGGTYEFEVDVAAPTTNLDQITIGTSERSG